MEARFKRPYIRLTGRTVAWKHGAPTDKEWTKTAVWINLNHVVSMEPYIDVGIAGYATLVKTVLGDQFILEGTINP